jgi:hypothetical protein
MLLQSFGYTQAKYEKQTDQGSGKLGIYSTRVCLRYIYKVKSVYFRIWSLALAEK